MAMVGWPGNGNVGSSVPGGEARVPSPRGGVRRGLPEEAPWDVVLLASAALILIAVGRVHAFIPGAETIRPGLVVTVVALLALLFKHGGARAPRLLKSRYGFLMAFVFVWAVLGVPFAIYPGNSFRYLVESFLRTGVVITVIAASIRNPRDLERLLRVYAVGAIIFSVGATGTEGFRDLRAGGYDPNDSAMFIVAAMPLVLHFLIKSESFLTRAFYGIGLLACGSAVVLSGSRGGFLALMAVLAFCLLFYRSIQPAVRVGVVAAVVAIVSVQATGEFWERMETIVDEDDYNRHSVTGRVELWTRGAGYMFRNPVLGVGINNFSVAEGRHPVIVERIQRGVGTRYSAPHSIWVQAGAELGIPGLLALFGLFGYAIRLLWRQGRRRPRKGVPPDLAKLRELSFPLIGVLIGLAVAGTFLTHAYTALLWGAFALVLGYVKVLALLAAREAAPAPEPVPAGGRVLPSGPPDPRAPRPSGPPLAPPPALKRRAVPPPAAP
jgi:putative inorganic carbon (hco3(-)) transporter